MSKRRILVTGGSGQIGTELQQCQWPDDVELVAPSRDELDLLDGDSLEQYISAGAFAAVINSAAYTAVDRAENEVLIAWKVNALAPAAIAAATRRCGIPVVHVSTDYVFDGRKDGPYDEEDPVAPLGVYGASKEAGEQAVRTGNSRHLILRTAWVFSAHGSNFVKTMLRLGKEKSLIQVVSDQRGCPTAASDVAVTLANITLCLMNSEHTKVGTFNFVNAGNASWYDFASEIFRQRESWGYTVPAIEPIGSEHYSALARRPAHSILSTEKIKREFAVEPRNWTIALRRVLDSLAD